RAQDKFIDLVKNTYRVLFSRGMKGCYVYFMDKDTERFFKSRMDLPAIQKQLSSSSEIIASLDKAVNLPFRHLQQSEVKPFVNCVPLYDLKAAAGRFSDEQQVAEWLNGQGGEDLSDINWVELPDAFRPRHGLFVAQVVGESMNRRMPNGSWCLFRLNPEGTRQGKIVLAQHRGIADVDNGGQFTVKIYESKKRLLPDGSWRHASITLRPDTTAPGYEPLIFTEEKVDDVKVIAELVAVLG
ncbi:MAG TPA: S24 family peptidase, partial [Smithellaceae bacterium]|nr:S24 family peptidase [Smithellaceae bacterium]